MPRWFKGMVFAFVDPVSFSWFFFSSSAVGEVGPTLPSCALFISLVFFPLWISATVRASPLFRAHAHFPSSATAPPWLRGYVLPPARSLSLDPKDQLCLPSPCCTPSPAFHRPPRPVSQVAPKKRDSPSPSLYAPLCTEARLSATSSLSFLPTPGRVARILSFCSFTHVTKAPSLPLGVFPLCPLGSQNGLSMTPICFPAFALCKRTEVKILFTVFPPLTSPPSRLTNAPNGFVRWYAARVP